MKKTTPRVLTPRFEFLPSLMEEGKIGRYDIIRKLGEGGTGMVFLGRDPYIKRYVALKVTSTASEQSRRSFLLEAQSAGRLNHPNIVAVFDFNVFGEYCYIAMEYVEGATLGLHCKNDRLLPLDKVAEIIFSVCHGLDYAHKQGVIHRDIKPNNLLFAPMGTVKITDFGTARIGGKGKEQVVVGTPAYMSPERLLGQQETGSSDIFSLACVLYEMLTGHRAFPGLTIETLKHRIVHEDPIPIRELRSDVPSKLAEVVMKALSKDPAGRFATCADFGFAVRSSMSGLPSRKDESLDFFDYILDNFFFRNFTKEQVKELVRNSNIIRVRAGATIITEGEQDDTFYVVLSGRVRIVKKERTIAMLERGHCFGEIAYISRQPRSATVISDTDASLMKINSIVLDRAPDSLRLLFFQNFALSLVHRLSCAD